MTPTEARIEAKRLFFNYYRAPNAPIPEDREPIFASATALPITYNNETVSAYCWGEQGPLVLCMHGLFGRGGQFAELVGLLLGRGFRVATFDAPGFGRSRASFITTDAICAALGMIADRIGPLHAIVAHSMGGKWALHWVSNGGRVAKMVCMSSVANGRYMFERYLAMSKLPEATANALESMIEAVDGPDAWARYSPLEAVRSLSIPGLVLHGEDDNVVPISEGALLHQAWPGSLFYRAPKCDHFTVLTNSDVLGKVLEFLI